MMPSCASLRMIGRISETLVLALTAGPDSGGCAVFEGSAINYKDSGLCYNKQIFSPSFAITKLAIYHHEVFTPFCSVHLIFGFGRFPSRV